jgi:hypothetical protein
MVSFLVGDFFNMPKYVQFIRSRKFGFEDGIDPEEGGLGWEDSYDDSPDEIKGEKQDPKIEDATDKPEYSGGKQYGEFGITKAGQPVSPVISKQLTQQVDERIKLAEQVLLGKSESGSNIASLTDEGALGHVGEGLDKHMPDINISQYDDPNIVPIRTNVRYPEKGIGRHPLGDFLSREERTSWLTEYRDAWDERDRIVSETNKKIGWDVSDIIIDAETELSARTVAFDRGLIKDLHTNKPEDMIKIVSVIDTSSSSEISGMREVPEIVHDPEYIKLGTSQVEVSTSFFQKTSQISGGIDLGGAEMRDFQVDVALKRFPTETLEEIAAKSGTGAIKAGVYKDAEGKDIKGEAVPDIGRDTPGQIKKSEVLSSKLQDLVQGPFHVTRVNWLYSDAGGKRIRETIPYNWEAYETVGERKLGGKRNFEEFLEIARGNVTIDNSNREILEANRTLHSQIEIEATEYQKVMSDIKDVVDRQHTTKSGGSVNIPDPITGVAPYKSESPPNIRQVDIKDYFAGKYIGASFRDVSSARAVSTRTVDYTTIATQHNLPAVKGITQYELGSKPTVLDVEHTTKTGVSGEDVPVATQRGEAQLRTAQEDWFKKREQLRVANLKFKKPSKSFIGELKDPRVLGGVIGISRILRGGGSGFKK